MNPLDLADILRNHTVYIQTHNFPDPDAIASAFGLQQFLDFHGVSAMLCYDGKIDRLSAKKMLDTFGITMHSKNDLPDMAREDLIVLVDSQKKNSNTCYKWQCFSGCCGSPRTAGSFPAGCGYPCWKSHSLS